MVKKNISFEDAIERIEEISDKLENDNVLLDESIELYKEGLKLLAVCKEKLDVAESEVAILINNDGEIKEESFNGSEELK